MIDIERKIDEHVEVIHAIRAFSGMIAELGKLMANRLAGGGKILWMGNGGSAADCQHLAAELVGRFSRERPALPSIALTTDTSALTAISNDYGYEKVFARQIEALCQPGDVVVGISTSGNSANVLEGLKAARDRGALTVGLTGSNGGSMGPLVDYCFIVPSRDTARIQEAHILMGHLLCDWTEAELADGAGGS